MKDIRLLLCRLFMVSGVEVLELEDLIKLRMQGQTSVHLVASAGQAFKPRVHNPAFENSPEQEKALRTSRVSLNSPVLIRDALAMESCLCLSIYSLCSLPM